MKFVAIISLFLFLLLAPFTFGIKFAAWLIDIERYKLEKPYKILKLVVLISLFFISLCVVYGAFHKI